MKLKLAAALLVLAPVLAFAEVSGSYFAVIVKDVEASSAWYQSVLGLQAKARRTEEGRYDIVNLGGPNLFVELLQLDAAAARPGGYIEGPLYATKRTAC